MPEDPIEVARRVLDGETDREYIAGVMHMLHGITGLDAITLNRLVGLY